MTPRLTFQEMAEVRTANAEMKELVSRVDYDAVFHEKNNIIASLIDAGASDPLAEMLIRSLIARKKREIRALDEANRARLAELSRVVKEAAR